MRLGNPFAGYQGKNMALGGYALLLGVYGAAFGTLLYRLTRGRRGRRLKLSLRDVLLAGVATHKLTRIVTRDWVTAPLRAPFTRYLRSRSGGEVQEVARGKGLRKAVGDLLTCPFCTGPWVAGVLVLGLVARPGTTRVVSSIFTAVTVSDFLHRAYAKALAPAPKPPSAARVDRVPALPSV